MCASYEACHSIRAAADASSAVGRNWRSRRCGLAVEAAAVATTTVVTAAEASAAIAATEAAAIATAWALHHQVNAGQCGVRLAAAVRARRTGDRVTQLGAQVCIGAWWLVFKAAQRFIAIRIACGTWRACRTCGLAFCGGSAAWIVTRRTLARAVIALAIAAARLCIALRAFASALLGWQCDGCICRLDVCCLLKAGGIALAMARCYALARCAARDVAATRGLLQ